MAKKITKSKFSKALTKKIDDFLQAQPPGEHNTNLHCLLQQHPQLQADMNDLLYALFDLFELLEFSAMEKYPDA